MSDQRQLASCTSCAPATTSTCQCGGCGCEKCGITTMVRPRFFPGQLLVDGDLQLLVDYATTKDRLHNRFLHGSGVVCGLLVRCHPCGNGKVVVEPGVALDCCGNDIIVPCPVELDINALVRDLRLKQLAGYDCGDPCDENADPNSPERVLRRYCLYLNYCEEYTDPVTPYIMDDQCASIECEFTRIREGYSFELRCPEEDECPPTVWDRIRDCIDDLELADRSADDANALSQYSGNIQYAGAQIRSNEIAAFEVADQDLLVGGTPRLAEFASRVDDPNNEGVTLKEIEIRETMDTMRATAAAVVHYDLLDTSTKASAEKRMPGLGEQVEAARAAVQNVREPLEGQVNRIESARDRRLAVEDIAQANLWISPDLNDAQLASAERQYFAYNVSTSQRSLQNMADIASQLRDWLLRSIEKRGLFADCRLRDEVLAVQIPGPNSTSPEAICEAAMTLIYAFLRYLIDCICAALNPPCTPCEDTGVKLACIEVEDCDVVRICNLERTFVLSWPAMRYWIPFLCQIGNAFEQFCCEFANNLQRPRCDFNRQNVEFDREFDYYQRTAPASRVLDDSPAVGNVLRFANISERSAASAINIGGNLGAIMMNDPILDIEGRARTLTAGTNILESADLISSIARGPSDFRREAEIRAEADVELVSRIDELSADMRKHLTARSLGSTSTIRKLREDLEEQRAANADLREKVEALMEARDE